MDLQAQLMRKLSRKGALGKSEQHELNYLSYMQQFGKSPTVATLPTPSLTTPDMATAQALSHGANPLSLAVAAKQLGSQEYIGYCEQFVEQSEYGHTGIYPSAVDAWNQQQDKAVGGLSGVQPGDAIYFSDPNQPYGHTGIYAGGNQFISATDSGIQQNDIGNWLNTTGQQLLGYIPGGINGK